MAIQNFDEAMKRDRMPFEVMVGGKDYKGYFANIRIARDSVPDGRYGSLLDADDHHRRQEESKEERPDPGGTAYTA